MNIAIFHNFMDNIGGAEIVSLMFARELKADIYTTLIAPELIIKAGFIDVLPRIHSIGTLPKRAPFKQQLTLWKFRRLNLGRRYDFYIISGDWAMSGAVHNKPNLWYVHSPLNEIWQFKDMVREEMLTALKRPIFDAWVWLNRKLTISYAQHVEHWVCNSINTKTRIEKFYKKEAEVIYPPINTTKYRYAPPQEYWLSVNRLVNHKRIEIQLEAFAQLPNERLIIVGSYEKGVKQFEDYLKYLEKKKPTNVEIIHWVSDEKLLELYSLCKGFITTSRDEDFGMTAVEALASGKLVIAPREGGYKESITDQETGILINAIDSEQLAGAIKKMTTMLVQNQESHAKKCQQQAAQFDTQKCILKIEKIISASSVRVS